MRKDGCGADPQMPGVCSCPKLPHLGSYCRAFETRPRRTPYSDEIGTRKEDEGTSICQTLFDSFDTRSFFAFVSAFWTDSRSDCHRGLPPPPTS